MGARVRIEQQLVGVEAMPGLGLVGPVDAIAVKRAGADVRQIAVKNLVGIFGQFDAAQLAFAFFVEQTDLDLGGVGGKQGEIGALAVPVRALRIGQTLFD